MKEITVHGYIMDYSLHEHGLPVMYQKSTGRRVYGAGEDRPLSARLGVRSWIWYEPVGVAQEPIYVRGSELLLIDI